MKTWPLLLSACLCLAACLGAPPDMPRNVYGAFVGMTPELESQLAEEAVRQLMHAYPPAENLLDFQPRIIAADGFGQKRLHAAQSNGYSIRQRHDVPPQCGEKSIDRKDSGDALRTVPTCYLLDDVDGRLRLTLYVAGDVWSRFFNEKEGRLRPAGAWTLQQRP